MAQQMDGKKQQDHLMFMKESFQLSSTATKEVAQEQIQAHLFYHQLNIQQQALLRLKAHYVFI